MSCRKIYIAFNQVGLHIAGQVWIFSKKEVDNEQISELRKK